MSHLNCVEGQLQYSQHKEKHYSRNSTTYVHWCLLYYSLSSKFCFNSIMYINTQGAWNLHIKWPSAEYYWSTFAQWGALHCSRLPKDSHSLATPTFKVASSQLLNFLHSQCFFVVSHTGSCIQDDMCNIENCEMWWLVLRCQSTTSSGHGSSVQLPVTTGFSLSSVTLAWIIMSNFNCLRKRAFGMKYIKHAYRCFDDWRVKEFW